MSVADFPSRRNMMAARAPAVQPADEWVEPRASSTWLVGLVLVQFAAQLVLLSNVGALRVYFRVAAFAAPLLCLIVVPKGGVRHPARSLGLVIMGLVAVEIFHPETAGFVGGLAHAFMYLAVLSPLFWVPRLRIDMKDFDRIILIFWIFYTCSALVGMLQVYYPGQFESQAAVQAAERTGLSITLANGEAISRPSGLTDSPGGAAVAGFYACVVGSGLLFGRARWWWRTVVLAGMTVGVFVIYLSHVRSLLVMSLICVLASTVLLGVRGSPRKAVLYGGLVVAIFTAAWFMAVDVGGASVENRFGTLTADSASNVYYHNRGFYLESTFDTLIPLYPLGAGLARWGMMSLYFGDSAVSPPLYAEIQWTAWVFDGGVPMMILYPLALLIATWTVFKIGIGRLGRSVGDLRIWGGVIMGYNVGAIAVTFNAPPFMGPTGVEFWMLNAMLLVVALRADHAEEARALAAPPD